MFEISERFTIDQGIRQREVEMLQRNIRATEKKLADYHAALLREQEHCNHEHVLFCGQQMTCEICSKELHE